MAALPPAAKPRAVIRQHKHLTIMKRKQPPREAAALFAPPFYLHCCSRTKLTCNNGKVVLGVCNSWWFFLLFVLIVITTESPAAAMNTCSHKQSRVLQFEDAGAKAYLSPVVFRGLVKSRTPVDALGLYEVSFLIVQPIKGFVHQMPKKKRRRLPFAAPGAAACRHGTVAAALDNNATYLVFADRAAGHQFRALSPPLPATKRHEDAVERSLCPNCVRPPRVFGLQNVTVRAKTKLKLTCQYDGNPPPLIEWYKRGRRIEPSKRTKIMNKKRRSVLTILRVSKSDAGKYECKAVSVTDEKVCASAHVTVNEPPQSRFDNSTTLWPLVDTPCPINSYCLNGGTCLYYEAVGELVCECAEGYKGKRCENKDVYNRGSKRRRTSCCGGDDGQQQPQQPQAVSAAALVLRRRVSDCLSSSNCASPPTTSLHQRRRRLRHVLFAKSLHREGPSLTARGELSPARSE